MYHKNANKKQKMCLSTTSGSHHARRMGIRRTSAGQQVPVKRATSAQKTESILGYTE